MFNIFLGFLGQTLSKRAGKMVTIQKTIQVTQKQWLRHVCSKATKLNTQHSFMLDTPKKKKAEMTKTRDGWRRYKEIILNKACRIVACRIRWRSLLEKWKCWVLKIVVDAFQVVTKSLGKKQTKKQKDWGTEYKRKYQDYPEHKTVKVS